MRNYLRRKVAAARSVADRHQPAEGWTWITTIAACLFVVFCAYVVTALYLVGWMLLG